MAATTAIIKNYEEGNNLDVSSVPDALVLYNPVLDTGSDRMGEDWTIISPNHHIRAALPPAIVFHGTADKGVPYATAVSFQKLMTENGNLCVLMTSVGKGHSFFNGHYFLERNDNTYLNKTLYESHFFLNEIGILDNLPREWIEGVPESIR